MKIRLEYEVPEGDYCSLQCEEKQAFKPCKYLYNGDLCTLFDALKPSYEIDGHTIIRRKLFQCRAAQVKPVDPHPSAA